MSIVKSKRVPDFMPCKSPNIHTSNILSHWIPYGRS